MNENSEQSFNYSFWIAFVVLLALGLVLVANNMIRPHGGGTSKRSWICNNLRQIDGAKSEWAVDHGITNFNSPIDINENDLKNYFYHSNSVRSVAGEIYKINPLNLSPEARLTHAIDGLPAGTTIRLGGSNALFEIILPDSSKGHY